MRFRGHGSRNEREVERCGRGDGDLRAIPLNTPADIEAFAKTL